MPLSQGNSTRKPAACINSSRSFFTRLGLVQVVQFEDDRLGAADDDFRLEAFHRGIGQRLFLGIAAGRAIPYPAP